VDFELEPWARDALVQVAPRRGRAILAGTPGLYVSGYRRASTTVLAALGAAPGVDAILLGGDTNAELPWEGARSTGGGAALHFLARGSCPILDALRRSRSCNRP
jgi:phosphoglycerate kinase